MVFPAVLVFGAIPVGQLGVEDDESAAAGNHLQADFQAGVWVIVFKFCRSPGLDDFADG